jgi:hypothetical protein
MNFLAMIGALAIIVILAAIAIGVFLQFCDDDDDPDYRQ